MIAFIKTLARASSPKPAEIKPAALRTLSVKETEVVSGGLIALLHGSNLGSGGGLAFGDGGGSGRS
jgi:hypothetical protein